MDNQHPQLMSLSISPKKTNRVAPRGDIDNYLKTLDVLNRIIWFDDDQIISLVARKEYSDEPRIELEVTEYGELPEARALREVR